MTEHPYGTPTGVDATEGRLLGTSDSAEIDGTSGHHTAGKAYVSYPDYTTQRRQGLPPGNLLGIPWRVALALQADGWTLRQAVTWCKVAPMPESVAGTRWERCRVKVASAPIGSAAYRTGAGGEQGPHGDVITDRVGAEFSDCPGCPRCAANNGYVLRRGSWRHTNATEQVFMLTKGMNYWANQETVREAGSLGTHATGAGGYLGPVAYDTVPDRRDGGGACGVSPAGRNPRNWVTPGPSPFPGAHFATFPPSLIEPFIKASCPAKCCPTCGAGWAPVVERVATGRMSTAPDGWATRGGDHSAIAHNQGERGETDKLPETVGTVTGYRPTCACGRVDWTPGTVLDPFAGAGTTLLVADRLGMDAVGIELNPEYAAMAGRRVYDDAPLFAEALP